MKANGIPRKVVAEYERRGEGMTLHEACVLALAMVRGATSRDAYDRRSSHTHVTRRAGAEHVLSLAQACEAVAYALKIDQARPTSDDE
jgi:hypothetical protein